MVPENSLIWNLQTSKLYQMKKEGLQQVGHAGVNRKKEKEATGDAGTHVNGLMIERPTDPRVNASKLMFKLC